MIVYLGFRLIEGIIARLPRRLAYAIGVVTSTLAFPLLARQRKALESNLHHVLPDMPGPQLRKLAWRNWLNYTKAWIDFFKIPRMDRRKLGALLSPSGLENLDAAMARGKGVIVVAPHMGSWELAAASWAASFGEIGVMVEQIEPRRLFDHVSALRSRMNIRVIPLSGAPILPAFCIRDANDAYIAIGEPPLFLTPSEDHRADVRGAMEQILATFERYIKSYPDQWHVLEPIWPEKPVVPVVTIPSPPAQAAVGD